MPIIFEPPAALLAAQSAGSLGSLADGSGVASSGGSQVWIAASPASGSALWGGCQVWLSFDGASYGQIGTIASRANQGVLTAAIAVGPGVNPDTTDTLAIDLSMSGGALPTGSDSDAQAGRTLCYVDGELIAYGLATPTTADAYDLTYLYRGLYGSAAAAHADGTPFVLLDDNIFKYNLPQSYAGQPLYFKFASFNAWGGGVQDLSTLTAITFTPAGGVVPSGLIMGGDASVSASGVITLATTGVTPGSYTTADITVDAKGRLTAASSGSIAVPAAANPTATVGATAVDGTASTFMRSDAAPALNTTGVTAGSFTYGSFTVDANGRLTAASSGATPPAAANPTGTIGLSAVNGSAPTFMRSDAAPALDVGIAPTWTNKHSWRFSGAEITILDSISSGTQGYAQHLSYESVWQAFGSYPENQFYCFGGTYSAPTAVSATASLGDFLWHGYDGSTSHIAARILATVNGAVGSGAVPGRLIFYTTNAAGTLTGALTIDSAQNLSVGPSLNQKIADATGTLYTGASSVSALPSASTVTAGARRFVTDATTATFGAAAVGGGSNGVPVYSDGAIWRIG